MAIAFISHSSKNKPFVEELAKKLGIDNCVVDEYKFDAGSKTLLQIFENLDRTDLFVLIISGAALESDWVTLEVNSSKDRLDLSQIKRFLPINIDKNVGHDDPRIPQWIKSNYDLKRVYNLNIIVNKIKRQLREITIESNPQIAERLNNFVGRNSLIEEFEEKYISIENIKPTTIVVSGIEGSGRRSFLKKALEKNKLFAATYEPAVINLYSSDGVDDLILKLDEGYSAYNREFIYDLKAADFNEKIKILKKSMLDYLNNHEVIFFIDDGCLVLRSGQFNDWFVSLINSDEFENRVSFCLISRYRLAKMEVNNLKFKNIFLHIPPLSDADKEKLFVKVMNIRQISFDRLKLDTILSFLNGFPDQIFYTADLIQDIGVDKVLKMQDYITDFYDNKLINQFRSVIDNAKTKNIVVVLAHFGTISHEYLVDIFYDNHELEDALDRLFILGVYELVGLAKEFLKVNHALADYVTRNRIKMSESVELRIKYKVNSVIKQQSDIPTYSDTLNTLRQGLINGESIPDHLLLPSLVLKSISSLYDRKDYKYVISLGKKILENGAYIDRQVKHEIHVFLCLAYARLKNSSFELEVRNIDFPDSEFLYGLYYRIKKEYYKAKRHLTTAVKHMPTKVQVKSELVLTLFSLEQYAEAESLARDNYNKHKNNPYYIQAYFKCLIYKKHRSEKEMALLDSMLKRVSSSQHPKAPEMKVVMQAQYDYYINGDLESAEHKLRSAIYGGARRNAYDILYKIYEKERNHSAINSLAADYNLEKDDDATDDDGDD